MKNNKHLSQFKSQKLIKNSLLETVNAVKQETGNYPTNFELACYINEIAGDMVTVKGMEAGVAVSDATLSSFARQLNEGAAEFVIGLHETAQITYEYTIEKYLTEEITPEEAAEYARRQAVLNAPENESVFRKLGRVFGTEQISGNKLAKGIKSITSVMPRVGGEMLGQYLGSSLGLPGEIAGTMVGGKVAADWWNSRRIRAGKTPMDPALRGWRPGGAAGFVLGGRLADVAKDTLGVTNPYLGLGIDLTGMIGGELLGNKLWQQHGSKVKDIASAAAKPVTAAMGRAAASFEASNPALAGEARKIGKDIKSAAAAIRDAYRGPAGAVAAQNAASIPTSATTPAPSTVPTTSAPSTVPTTPAAPAPSASSLSQPVRPAAPSVAAQTVSSAGIEAEAGSAAKNAAKVADELGAASGLGSSGSKAAAQAAGSEAAERVAAAGMKAGAKGVAKGLGKAALKAVPGIGLLASLYFAGSRALKGDWTGAAIDLGAGAAGLIPGVGTAASLGLAGLNLGRDVYMASSTPESSDTTNSGSSKWDGDTSAMDAYRTNSRQKPAPFGLPGVQEDVLLEINNILIENCATSKNQLDENAVKAVLRTAEKLAAQRAAKRAAEEAAEAAARTTPVQTVTSGSLQAEVGAGQRAMAAKPQPTIMQRVASASEKGAAVGAAGLLYNMLRPGGRSVIGVADDSGRPIGLPEMERESALQTTGIRTFHPGTGDFVYIPHTQIVR